MTALLTETLASIAYIAETALAETTCDPSAARAAILDEATWGVPSATRAAISAFTVDRHNAVLHHVAQLSSYHPATLAWQRHFLNILSNQRHSTPSGTLPAGVPYYSPTLPYPIPGERMDRINTRPTPAPRPPDPDGHNHHPYARPGLPYQRPLLHRST